MKGWMDLNVCMYVRARVCDPACVRPVSIDVGTKLPNWVRMTKLKIKVGTKLPKWYEMM